MMGFVLLLAAVQGAPAHAFASKKSDAVKSSAASPESDSLIWVTRKDGATSCGTHKGQTLEVGAAELQSAGVKVLNSRKANDGKMHAQSCGMPTGSLNAYQIARDDLAKAVALGFEEDLRK